MSGASDFHFSNQQDNKQSKLQGLACLFLEGVEEQTAGLAAGVEAAVHAQPVQLLAAAAVDLQHLVERSDVPDVDEGHLTQLGAPLHGDADAVEEREQPVGPLLAQVEAHVGALPHAVH